MICAAFRKNVFPVGARVVIASVLVAGAHGAACAQTADSSTAISAVPGAERGAVGRQLWRISDYTTVELVAREPGAGRNEQPWQVEPNTLHAMLQRVQVLRAGAGKPLFAIDELNALVSALTDALGRARPDQDIALVSSARHEDNTFYGLTAVTARLFVADGHLNLIVRDARFDFYDTARGTGVAPHFAVGSRNVQGVSTIQSAGALGKRADWLVLSAAPEAAPGVPAAPVAPAVVVPPPVASPAVVAPAPQVAPAAAPVMAPPPVVSAPPAVAPAPGADAEQRLTTLKRLYDKGLITKPEYEKKRQEILKGL
jgi:hypothetical protein